MKKITILLLSFSIFLLACKKKNLDSLAFPSKALTAYEFEKYDAGYSSVPDIYSISADKRKLITFESIDKSNGEKHTIYAVYIGDLTTIDTDSIILYCHGQSLHMDAYWPRASLLANIVHKYNYGVLMMDYRGYGMSEGTPTETALYEDVDASIDWLISQGATASKTFYYGYSLGCIPVIDRAAYRKDFIPSKIILESPLATVEHLAQSSTIINVNPNFVSTLEFNNAEKIKDVDVPLLWLHGVEDDYIAIKNGELIFQNYDGIYKEAIRVDGAGHGNVPSTMDYKNYIKRLEVFIKK